VTPSCVTGFSRQRERLQRPSAVSRGLCVGWMRRLEAAVHGATLCRLNCGNTGESWPSDVVARAVRARRAWAMCGLWRGSRTDSGQGPGRSRRCVQPFAYRLLVAVASCLALLARSSSAKDAEIRALGREAAVLRRAAPWPHLSWSVRAVLAALARVRRRRCAHGGIVTPGTLLR